MPTTRSRLRSSTCKFIIGNLLLLGVASAAPAYAQTAADGESPVQGASGSSDGDIVVTATRREASLNDVPLAVTALSGEGIVKSGAANFTDFAVKVPGLSFVDAGGGGVRPILRGVSSFTGSPTVAIYVDDVPIQTRSVFQGTAGAADVKFVDLDRIEVLRGPQGTIYGGGSMGGAIRYVMRQPSLTQTDGQVRAAVSATGGGDPSFQGSATVGVPLVEDTIGLRLSGNFEKLGGYIDRVSRDRGPLSRRTPTISVTSLCAARSNSRWAKPSI